MKLHEIVDISKYAHIVATLQADCAPYIAVLKQMHNPEAALFRGSDSGQPDVGHIKLIEPRTNRNPLDTPKPIHDFINDEFEERFNYPYRNGLFVCGNSKTASAYGALCAVFPIGPLKFIWSSTIEDMSSRVTAIMDKIEYEHDDDESDVDYDDLGDPNVNKELATMLENFVISKYSNTDLAAAIASRHEIMLANRCYVVNIHDYQAIIQEILK
jgi:hypothetical protein